MLGICSTIALALWGASASAAGASSSAASFGVDPGRLKTAPFGEIAPHLVSSSPWRGFHDDDSPLLLAVRFERGKLPAGARCEALAEEVAGYRPGQAFDPARPAFDAWGPWSDDDLEAVRECDDFPCRIKLASPEVASMRAVPPEARRAKWESLVVARASAYVTSGKRSEYEFPGDPVEPWARLGSWGFPVSEALLSAKPALYARSLAFAPGRFRPLRQILDARGMHRGTSAEVVIRDAYTAHYFDGWGEWIAFGCDPKSRMATLGQALVVEFDLLKKNDIISMLSRGKMKSTVDERARVYLDEARPRILKEPLE